MPVLRVYHHGTMASVGNMPNPNPPKRGKVVGWSTAAARRNTKFLYSVRASGITGDGFAITLTLRDCPTTHEQWHKLRRAYIERLRRMGLIRLHWVTEWQRRGVPHLHLAAWFPESETPQDAAALMSNLIRHWLEAGAAELGALSRCQHVAHIDGPVGWFQYVSKHAARGAKHYQRDTAAIPRGWEKTGRLWGHSGDWPTDEAMEFDLSHTAFYAYRRIVQRWRMADARASGDRRRIKAARRMLQASNRVIGQVRGVSEWVTMDMQARIVVHLGALGHEIDQTG